MRELTPYEKQYIADIKAIIQEKVVGKITAAHDEFGHWYVLPSGKKIASVTSKLIVDKPHLPAWAAKLAFEWMEKDDRWKRMDATNRDEFLQGAILAHTDARDTAGSIGHKAHEVIENYLKLWIAGEKLEDITKLIPEKADYRVWGACRSAEASIKKYPVIPVASEILVGWETKTWECAGTLDCLMVNLAIPDFPELELFDWKSSNNVSDTYAMQIAAYKKSFEMMTGYKIARARVSKLDKGSDKFKIYNIPNLVQAFKAYKDISAVYDWRENGKKKLVEDKIVIHI